MRSRRMGWHRMGRHCARLLASLLLLVGGPALEAHEVVLLSGERLEGEIVEETEAEIVFQPTFGERRKIARDEVARLDASVPPLREQLAWRLERAAGSPRDLHALWRWAKEKGFPEEERRVLLERIIALEPQNARARQLLGHVRVQGRWVSPEEAQQAQQKVEAERNKAKGLVVHDGEWVTPEEKAALEKGLLRDGNDWVSEEEWHRRRGERLEGGAWVRIGEAEGKAFAAEVQRETGQMLAYLWSPHFDVLHDVGPELAESVRVAAEAIYSALRQLLRPQGEDLPEDGRARILLALHHKPREYLRFAEFFAASVKSEEVAPGWITNVPTQHTWWWITDRAAVGCYLHPNTEQTFTSNVMHHLGYVLLSRYRINYRFPPPWLLRGLAYHLELQTLGYTLTFSLGGGVTRSSDSPEDALSWTESANWREALTRLVRDDLAPPMPALAALDDPSFRYEEIAKSWSVVEHLIVSDPGRFKAFVDAMKASSRPSTPDEVQKALQAAYGLGWQGLELRWKAWVRAGYPGAVPEAGAAPPDGGEGGSADPRRKPKK